jgi:hypothetical protein
MKSKIFAIIVISFFVIGCGLPKNVEYKAPDACYTAEGEQKTSILLNILDNPGETAFLLKANTYALMKKDIVTGQKIFEFFDEIEELLVNPDTTYSMLFNYVRAKVHAINKDVGVLVLLLSQHNYTLSGLDTPIYECDRALLEKHIAEQRIIVYTMTYGS